MLTIAEALLLGIQDALAPYGLAAAALLCASLLILRGERKARKVFGSAFLGAYFLVSLAVLGGAAHPFVIAPAYQIFVELITWLAGMLLVWAGFLVWCSWRDGIFSAHGYAPFRFLRLVAGAGWLTACGILLAFLWASAAYAWSPAYQVLLVAEELMLPGKLFSAGTVLLAYQSGKLVFLVLLCAGFELALPVLGTGFGKRIRSLVLAVLASVIGAAGFALLVVAVQQL